MFCRPCDTARLAEIWDEFPHPLVLELLWEIHRLRSTVSRANQMRHFLGKNGSGAVPSPVWQCFGCELDAEPLLTDRPTPRQQALIDEAMRKNDRDT